MAIKKPKAPTFIRVGDDYYKQILRTKSSGDAYEDWQKITRQTIIDDFGKKILWEIPKYDSFCLYPNHFEHKPVIHQNYNKYYPFIHEPKKGSIKWTMRLMRHVFGSQVEIGLDYIQLLYERPSQILPILCLVSYDNQTGKTTFLDWLNEFFKNNMAIIGNQDLQSQFNSLYATKLIVAIDESKIDKQHVLEKIKSLATAKTINVNNKFVTPYTVDFFGKIIMCSNYEDNFISAKDEDIRYWIRKLGKPQFKNYNIEDDLKKELPAFVYYLKNRTMVNDKQSRMWFNPDELFTQALGEIRFNSQETVIKHIMEELTDVYDATGEDELHATPSDIKNMLFKNNSRVDPSYIRRLLKSKFNMDNSDKIIRYSPLEKDDYGFNGTTKITKTGRPFTFKKEHFYLNGNLSEKVGKIKELFNNEDDINHGMDEIPF